MSETPRRNWRLKGPVLMAAAAVLCTCGRLTVDDWVGVYSGADSYVFDGGTESNTFEVTVTLVDRGQGSSVGTVSVGGFQSNGLVYHPFRLFLAPDGLSASRNCSGPNDTSVSVAASLKDKKTLLLNGGDCMRTATFSASVTRK